MTTSHQLPKFKHRYYKLWTLPRTNFFFFETISFYALAPAGRGVITFLYSFMTMSWRYWQLRSRAVLAWFCLSLPLGLNSLERNDIVLLLLTLGLKAQKRLARGRASESPRVNVPNNFRPARAKAFRCIICSEKGCYRFVFRNTD